MATTTSAADSVSASGRTPVPDTTVPLSDTDMAAAAPVAVDRAVPVTPPGSTADPGEAFTGFIASDEPPPPMPPPAEPATESVVHTCAANGSLFLSDPRQVCLIPV